MFFPKRVRFARIIEADKNVRAPRGERIAYFERCKTTDEMPLTGSPKDCLATASA